MTRESGLGRKPACEMSAHDLLRVTDALERAGIDAWLDGGWAVDAALTEQTRAHDDLDLVVELRRMPALEHVLAELGYLVASGGAPLSVELVDELGRQVDAHPVRLTSDGDGLYVLESGEDWLYPAAGFDGEGSVLGRPVRCLTPEVQVLCHSGYEPHRSSYDDVWALSRRFDIPVPEQYLRPRETYPLR